MIHGVHLLLYSRDAEADRVFFARCSWFRLCRCGSRLAHLRPAACRTCRASLGRQRCSEFRRRKPAATVLYLMCDDLAATIASLNAKGAATTEVKEERWAQSRPCACPAALASASISHATRQPCTSQGADWFLAARGSINPTHNSRISSHAPAGLPCNLIARRS